MDMWKSSRVWKVSVKNQENLPQPIKGTDTSGKTHRVYRGALGGLFGWQWTCQSPLLIFAWLYMGCHHFMHTVGHKQLGYLLEIVTSSTRWGMWSSPSPTEQRGRAQWVRCFPKRGGQPLDLWVHGHTTALSPVSATEPHSMRKAPCSNADPEMSVRIDLERRIRSEIYDFVSEHPCHCCAVRLLSLVHMDDGSWTKHGTELSKASGSLSALFDRLGLSKPHSSHWNWNRWHGSNKCIRSSELSWVLPRK